MKMCKMTINTVPLGTDGPLIAGYTGFLNISTLNTFTDTVTLRFSTDGFVNYQGFRIRFYVQPTGKFLAELLMPKQKE